MISPDTGEVIAHISIEMRLAIPISELYRLFLERHPADRSVIEDLTSRDIVNSTSNNNPNPSHAASATEDESRLYNELEVVIKNATDVEHISGRVLPATYIYFQLLG